VTAAASDGLLGPADVRRLADTHGVLPTKRWGQNFVVDPNSVRRIVRVAGLHADDVVIEVGPGLGSLTLGLLPVTTRVIAVEVDPSLATALASTVAERLPAHSSRLAVLAADAMTVTAAQLAAATGGADPTAFVANLPYNVAVPVLLHLLEEVPTLRYGLVMVQAEVADRLAAPPGSRVYGVPSLKTAWWAQARRVGTVPRSVFWPVPNVDSALVAFTRRTPPSTTASRVEVFRVVDAAFAQRRKSLRAALSGWAGSAAAAESALTGAGIDPRARGESLDIAAFARLAEHRPVVRSSA
jgi:16S rRNA (adenine1518-N6/adenine1519-N6)-dimethyltransferase